QIGQGQFGVDGVDVIQRRHLAGHVDDVVVVEATHHVRDGIGFADVGQEFVAQALALRGAGHQAGDVDEFHCRRQYPLRLDDGGEFFQARVWHRHHAGVRLDGAEREVLCLDAGLGQRIEQGGFADVRQPYDTALETHFSAPLSVTHRGRNATQAQAEKPPEGPGDWLPRRWAGAPTPWRGQRGILASGSEPYRRQGRAGRPAGVRAMSEQRVVYQFPISHYCEKTRWQLDRKGMPYQTRNLLPGTHRLFSRTRAGVNTLPVLRDGKRLIGDSTRIAYYLEKYYPQVSLLPADSAARQQVIELEQQFDR